MKAGDRVQLRGGGVPRTGKIVLCSPNENSLIVQLDDGFPTRSGVYVNIIPLLRTNGVYRELASGESVDVEIAVIQ